MSVSITIKNAKKAYGDNVVIEDLSLSIKEGEFFTLLGPSGCGKTTLLRMIAGFNSIEGGDFFFNDKRINDIDPSKRNIGMVFQNYAIFPNMNVRKNVEFGLKNRKLSKDVIAEKVEKYMAMMHIDEYAERRPDRLSGGQQQRVALARALVISPDILLMDEPLSNLDAKLRVEMRTVIKSIQKEVGITNVYVTHDQEEAMAVSDRIAVMNAGTIQQVGTPKAIYQRPKTLFVASFIGRSNLINAELLPDKMIRFSNGYMVKAENIADGTAPEAVTVCVRPEEFRFSGSGTGIKAKVDDCVFLGLNTHYFLTLESGEKVESIQESQLEETLGIGTDVFLDLNTSKMNVFSAATSLNLCTGVMDDRGF